MIVDTSDSFDDYHPVSRPVSHFPLIYADLIIRYDADAHLFALGKIGCESGGDLRMISEEH